MKPGIVIIAAMDREIAPLVRHWQRIRLEDDGWSFPAWVNDIAGGNVLAVAAGMGLEPARRATVAALAKKPAQYVISAGWAGAADVAKTIAQVVIPAVVVDAASGARFEVTGGEGTLVTVQRVAHPEDKARLRNRFGADIIDMEASAVAAEASKWGLEFLAVKSVSDASSDAMPPMDDFRGPRGEFLIAKFIIYLLLHPRWWGAMRKMARESDLASKALCQVLEGLIEKDLGTRN